VGDKKGAEPHGRVCEHQLAKIATKLSKGKNIYKKKKDVEIYLISKKELLVEVCHEDKRHSMKLAVIFSHPNLVINDVQCKMEIYPHKECIQAISSLRIMIGKRVQPGIMKESMKIVKNNGCTHLNNLFQEACYSVIQGQGIFARHELEKLFPGISSEQITKILMMFRPELIDSCVSFTKRSGFMQILEKTPLPPGAERLKTIK